MSVPAESLLQGLAASILIGTICATLGVWVVLRRMAFIGDALAHTVLPGLVIALLLERSLFLGALAAGLATAVGIGWLSRRGALREDSAIGVLFTGMFALGVLLAADRDPEELGALLFGNLLGIGPPQLALLAGVGVLVVGGVLMVHKELELASYDPTYAETVGIRTDGLRYWLLILLALAVVAGIQAAGVLLTTALLITPAAAASLLTARLPAMMALASLIATVSTFAGWSAAGRFGVPSGAAVVLACTACFALAWALRRRTTAS